MVLVLGVMFLVARGNHKDKDVASGDTSSSATEEDSAKAKFTKVANRQKELTDNGKHEYTTAEELYRDYQSNEVSADEKYRGKAVTISGIMGSVAKSFNDAPYLLYAVGKLSFGCVHADLFEVQIKIGQNGITGCSVNEKVANIKRGQEVNMTCIGRGMLMGTPMLEDCIITDGLRQKSPTP